MFGRFIVDLCVCVGYGGERVIASYEVYKVNYK